MTLTGFHAVLGVVGETRLSQQVRKHHIRKKEYQLISRKSKKKCNCRILEIYKYLQKINKIEMTRWFVKKTHYFSSLFHRSETQIMIHLQLVEDETTSTSHGLIFGMVYKCFMNM
jgi:hypothetical protein